MVGNEEFALPLTVFIEGQPRELVRPPGINAGFRERTEAVFVSKVEIGHQLLVDDMPLTCVADGMQRRWSWTPNFFAGTVRADLLAADGRWVQSWDLDVSPHPDKLGRDVFAEMVAELRAFDPALVIGREPARERLGTLGEGVDLMVALARLRARDRALRRTLGLLSQEPIRALRPRRRLVPLHSVRRADHQTALAALRQPALLAAAGAFNAEAVAGTTQPPLADVPDVERHLDCPANRCVLAMAGALSRRCLDLLQRLERAVDNEERSDTVTPLADRWPVWRELLIELHGDLVKFARRPPFAFVARPEISVAGLNAVSAHPSYARFWRTGWEALRTGTDSGDDDELVPVSPTWELYERWCFTELRRRLERWMPEFVWTRTRTNAHEGLAPDGTLVTLTLQPRAPCTNGLARKDLWSISGRRVPDMVLSWKRKETEGFIVLDAKYRVSRPNVLDAMSSAHIYQDSLRMGDHRPLASILLVPAAGGAPWLETSAHVREHRVGVAGLRPRTEPPTWLRDLAVEAVRGRHTDV